MKLLSTRGINFITLQTRNLHHSPTKGRFYTNRFYVKKCSNCSSVNSLTLVNCSRCSSALTDEDIRLRNLDHICQVSNSRKRDSEDSSSTIYRCFDFTLLLNPNPSSLIHISAFPNGTFYDIKNFRKSHVDLISRMRDKCLGAFEDILSGKLIVQGVENEVLEKLKVRLRSSEGAEEGRGRGGADSASGPASASGVSQMVDKAAVFGFNYPNTHSHVDMHALLPPIYSFNVFKTPFFYPLEKVVSDLRIFGQVRPYSPSQIRNLNESDEILEQVMRADRLFRDSFSI